MAATYIGLLGIVVLLVLFSTKMPIAFVMALIGFLGFSHLVSLHAGLNMLAKDIFEIFGSYNLTVIPLFIFMGQIAFYSGISNRLYESSHKFMGNITGGLAMATICACAGFAAICGSTIATATTMATVSLPEMKKYGYDPKLATGAVAAGGTLGILIPPSTIFIVYGIMTQQSIGKLFAAGIVPGIILTLLFAGSIYFMIKIRPSLGGYQVGEITFAEKVRSLVGILETLIIFLLIMVGLFKGFFTPTEAGAIGCSAALLIALARRNITLQNLLKASIESVAISCMILVVIMGTTIFGHFMAVTRIPFDLADWVGGLLMPRSLIFVFILFVYLVGGFFMDGLAFLLLTIPIFFPVVQALGYDPIWFGVIVVLVTEMAAITPPVGINVYSVSGVARDIPLEDIFKGVSIFIVPLVILIVILILFPQVALFLPSMVF